MISESESNDGINSIDTRDELGPLCTVYILNPPLS